MEFLACQSVSQSTGWLAKKKARIPICGIPDGFGGRPSVQAQVWL
jgi:hypothetical protein